MVFNLWEKKLEIIDLKKYLTPVENQNENKQLEVVLFSDQVLVGSNFYSNSSLSFFKSTNDKLG